MVKEKLKGINLNINIISNIITIAIILFNASISHKYKSTKNLINAKNADNPNEFSISEYYNN